MAGVTSYPRTTIQLQPDGIVTAYADRNDLIVGQLGAGASATSEALNTGIEVLTNAEIRTLVGDDHLYNTIINWKEGNDNYSPLSVIGIDESGTGVAATASIAFTGTATADGTYTISCVDEKDFTVTVSVSSGDAAAAVGAAVDAAFDALTNYPPFVLSNATGTATFTASDVGTIGNKYSLKIDGTIAGLSYTVTGFASGANDPVLTSILDNIDGLRYTSIHWPENWSASTSVVTDVLDARFNASNDIMDGVAFMGYSETYANDLTLVGSLNSASLVIGGNNKISSADLKGSAIVQSADYTMAYFMGVESKRLTLNAPIASDIVAVNAPLDAIGGSHTASLPYFNTPLSGTPVTASTNLFSNTEQVALATAGFSTFGVNRAQNGMIMGEVVTTRTTDAAGNVNDSFRFLNYVRTGSVCREIFYNNLKATFAQSRLAEGQARPGYSVANEETIRAELNSIYRDLAEQALVESGPTAEQAFSANTTLSISKSTRTVTITSPLYIVTQLGTINYVLSLDFSIE